MSFKSHLTAQELADLGLAGFPGTKMGVLKFAEANGWYDQPDLIEWRTERGGTFPAYPIDLLPAEARLAYLARFADGSAHDPDLERQVAETTETAGLSGRATGEQAARLKIVAMADRFAAQTRLSAKAADRLYCDLYNEGGAPAPVWIYDLVPKVSPRTVQRWRAAIRSGRAQSLCVDRAKNRQGSGVLDRAEGGAIKATVLALVAKNQHLSAKHIRAFCRDKFGDEIVVADGEIVSMPPLRTFQQKIRDWKAEHAHALLKISNPDRYKSTVRFAATGSTRADRLNECWQIDASPADVMTTDGRQTIYVSVDVYSRRMIVLVSKTPRASAVGLLIRKCIHAWGVPETIKTDNGSDFTAHSTRHLLAALDIEIDLCAAYSPEQKGIVERAIGTYQRGLSAMLDGFIGHSVADRKAIEGRKSFAARRGAKDESLFGVDLSACDLQDYSDRWCDTLYQHEPHAGLKGTTPFQRAAAYPGHIRAIEDESALDILLAPIAGKDGRRTVTRQGIRIDGDHYAVRTIMPGTDVFCRHDPKDLGKVHVFEADGETFLEIAICPELAGADPAEVFARQKAAQAAFINAGTAELRKGANAIKKRDIVEGVLRTAERDAGSVVAFPKVKDSHTTPALDAAARAAGPNEPRHSKETLAFHEQMKAEAAAVVPAANSNVQRIKPETKEQRFRRALDLERQIEAGEPVETDAALWLGGYRNGAEYRALKGLYESFGEAALR